MTYGIKDLGAPYISRTGTLGDIYRDSYRTACVAIYRLETDGWHYVAHRVWGKYINKNNQ